MRPIRLFFAIAMLVLSTACSTNNQPLPTLAQLSTVTLAPQIPAEVTEAAMVTPVAPSELTQNYTGGDFLGREISVQFPADWVLSDLLLTDGALVLSNNQAAIDNREATLTSGSILVSITSIPAEFAMDEEGNVQSLVDLVRSVATESQAIAAVNELMLGDFNAAQALFSESAGDLLVIVVEQGKRVCCGRS